MSNIDLTLSDNKTLTMINVEPEKLEEVMEWVYGAETFKTIKVRESTYVLNKAHLVRVAIY